MVREARDGTAWARLGGTCLHSGALGQAQADPARSDEAMSQVAKGVQAVTKKHGGANFEFSRSDKEAADLWQGRKAALWSVLALRENAKVWTTDVWCVYCTLGCDCWIMRSLHADGSVPISKLPRLIRETSEDFEARGLTACHFGCVA